MPGDRNIASWDSKERNFRGLHNLKKKKKRSTTEFTWPNWKAQSRVIFEGLRAITKKYQQIIFERSFLLKKCLCNEAP